MSEFETRFGAEDDAERIRATFYGFVGAHASGIEGDAHIRTEIDRLGPRLLVRLWSAEAMAEFLSNLDAGERPDRRRCYE